MIRWKNEVEYLRGLGKRGHSIADVARLYSVSRQRAKQVVDKYVPEWKYTYGKAMRKDGADLRTIQKRKYRQFKKLYPNCPPYELVIWWAFCPIFKTELDYFSETKQNNSVSLYTINDSLHAISYKAASILRGTTYQELEELLLFAGRS